MKIFNVSIILLALLSSCKPNLIENGIKRDWSFDSITYKNEDIMYCFTLNMIDFKDNNEIVLPYVFDDCLIFSGSEITYGEWYIVGNEKEGFKLIIKSQNKAFNDKYHLTFHKEKNTDRLLAELKSDKMRIKMRSALNPVGNENFINQLVDKTKKIKLSKIITQPNNTHH